MTNRKFLVTRVLAVYSQQVLITIRGGVERAVLAGRLARDRSPGVITPGDVVKCEESDDRYMVVDVMPRTSEFGRIDRAGRFNPILANLDIIVVVVSGKEPPLSLSLLDRFIAGAAEGNVDCVVCLNKIDLSDSEMKQLELYPPLGYPLVGISAVTGEGIEELLVVIRGRLSALVGASGVGKSSIINRLLGREAQVVRSLSAKIGRGRRTTSLVRFLPLADGNGFIADTPGREWLGDLPFDSRHVAELLPDFRPFIHRCRFNDCSHRVEPGCAVREAVSNGHIHKSRYTSFLSMTVDGGGNTGMTDG